MTEIEHQIVDLITADGYMTISKICQSTGLTPAVVNNILVSLRVHDIIKRVGAKKTGHWEVICNFQ